MRFITRTLPWIVILLVIAFFISLKQPSGISPETATPSEKEVTKVTEETNDTTSVISVSDDEPEELIPILEEKTSTVEEETSAEMPPWKEALGNKLYDAYPSSDDQPSTTETDIKLFEGATEETLDSSESSPETDTQPDSPELNENASTEGPILLGMNPPLLNQPIQNSPKQQPNNEWKWSTAVKEAQAEAAQKPRPDGMPSMYGPAENNVTITEERNHANNDTTAEENGTSADTQELNRPTGTPSPQEFEQRKPLSPEMQKLRDGVRQTIHTYSKPILNTQDNTVAQLLDVCEAYGCDAEVLYTDKHRKINAFANLCYNYPCAGYRPLKISRGRIVPKIGYGFQEKPGQMLAVMALARVPEDYPIQVSEETTGTVADLVEQEKKTCRLGEDLSFKLIGIMRYTPTNQSWTSNNGQTWIVDKLVYEVLKQPAKLDTVAGVNRLLALSYAVQRRAELDEPINGAYAKAAKYLTNFQDYALSMINDDGTWHSQFFKAKGTGSSNQSRLRSTGHILRWLVFSLPEERLRDPRIIRAIAQVNRSLNGNARYGLASASPQTIDSRLTAVHALVIYDNRFFKLFDAVEETTAPETAQLEAPSLR